MQPNDTCELPNPKSDPFVWVYQHKEGGLFLFDFQATSAAIDCHYGLSEIGLDIVVFTQPLV